MDLDQFGDDDEFDYVNAQSDDLEQNLELAQQFRLVDEDDDEEMEDLQIYNESQSTGVPQHSSPNDAVNAISTAQTDKAYLSAMNERSDDLEHNLNLSQQFPVVDEDEKVEELQTYNESQSTGVPQHSSPNDAVIVISTTKTGKANPNAASLPSSSLLILCEPELMYHSPEKELAPRPTQSPEPQSLGCLPPRQVQLPESWFVSSPPPNQSTEPQFPTSIAPPPIQSPHLQSIPSPVSNVQKIKKLLRTVPFLKIPLHFGFKRIRNDVVASDGSDSVEVFYTHTSQDNGKIITLKSAEDVHDYLLQSKIHIPIYFFTFEREIDICYLYDESFWAEMIHKEDLSEGMEKVPIPVICAEKSVPGKLAKYSVENVLAEHLTVEKNDDDGFLLCCDCENDCKDKMNCPCFLKTLDNCSKKTREVEGDENIGYKNQRLEKPQISGIFECNRKCKCRTDTCMNRVTQNGLICKLQLFMTDLKGWGVRTLCDIPKGTYITSYVGEIVSEEYATEATRKWDEGKWKYLTTLKVSHDMKEGYESDAVEPEGPSPPSPLHEAQGSTEIIASAMSKEDWSDFLSQEDDCVSPPNLDHSIRPSSPATSCFITPSVFRDDDDEENEDSVMSAAGGSDSEFPKIIHRRRKRLHAVSKADRVLRSDDLFEETPEEFENLMTGRFECGQRSLADNNMIQQYSQRSERLSEHVASNKFQKRRKITTFVFWDELSAKKALEEVKIHRKKEFKKRRNTLKRSTRLSAQYVSDKVLPSIKQKLRQSNSFEVTQKPSSPCTSPFAFLVPPAPPPPCKPNSFGEKNSEEPSSQVSIRRRGAGAKKILQKARKGLGGRGSRGGRRRRGGDLKKPFSKTKKYDATSKSILPGDHPLLQLDLSIDALNIGNVGRYLNHSCNPNVFPQYIFIESHDLRFPDISFFAKRNIKAGEELTWDYGYVFEECDEEEVKKEEDGQRNQEQGVSSEKEAQKDQKTDNDDRSAMSIIEEALSSYKRVHTSLVRNLVRRMSTASGTRNKRKSLKRQRTRLPCYCGQDNCIGRVC